MAFSHGYQPTAPIQAVLCWTPLRHKGLCKGLWQAVQGFKVGGLKINSDFLMRILQHEEFVKDTVYTTWVESEKLHMPPKTSTASSTSGTLQALGCRKVFRWQVDAPFPAQVTEAGAGHMFMQKSQVKVKVGDLVDAGGVLAVLSAMKMLNDA